MVACNVLKPLLKIRTLVGGRDIKTHLSMCQPVKAVMDCQHIVTLDVSHPHSGSNGSIHTSTGGANVHDGYIDVALVATKNICVIFLPSKKSEVYTYEKNDGLHLYIWWVDVSQQLVGVPVVLKAPACQ